MSNDRTRMNRREILKWTTTVGLASGAPNTVAAVVGAAADDNSSVVPPEVTNDERNGDVQVAHPIEYETIRDRVTAATQRDRPEEKFGAQLEEKLRDDDPTEVDLYVRTVGKPETVTTERYGNQIDGWAPKQGEIQRLSRFGELGHIPRFLSTKMSLDGVHQDDLKDLAAIPFVLTLELRPEVNATPQDNWNQICYADHDDRRYFHPDTVRGDQLLGFEQVSEEDGLEDVKIGILDSGYDTSRSFVYPENYAAEYIDEAKADEFNDDWRDDSYSSGPAPKGHGTPVTNTLAYMLDAGWDEMIVPMKITSSHSESENARDAIEWATEWDLDVINISWSFGTSGTEQHCQSEVCEELRWYAKAGHVAVAPVGNNKAEAGEPGASQYSVSVGGIHNEPINDGYEGDPETSYSDGVTYDDETQCSHCARRPEDELFAPDVFGVMAMYDEDELEQCVRGTSNASPQFAAAALLMKQHGTVDFWRVKDLARDQDHTPVYPQDEAKAGQVFYVPDLLDRIAPTAPSQVGTTWVTDEAAKIVWAPATTPETADNEVDYYQVVIAVPSQRGFHSIHEVDAETDTIDSLEVDGLDPDTSYSASVRAYDVAGRESDWAGTGFTTEKSD